MNIIVHICLVVLVFKIHFCETSNKVSGICDAQWLLLNTTAAYSPENPTREEQKCLSDYYLNFVDKCGDEHPELINFIPENVSMLRFESRRELVVSLCVMENIARNKINMQYKQCNYNKFMNRWRYTDGYI